MHLSAHARTRVMERLPGVDPALIEHRIAQGGVTVSCSWMPAGGWQSKEFLVFWMADKAWVAILDIQTRACLTVIPAWNDENGKGALLYEKIDGSHRIVAEVDANHIRRAIRCLDDGTPVPPQFERAKFVLSARIVFANGRHRVCRLDKREVGLAEMEELMQGAAFVDQYRQLLLAKFAAEPMRQAVLMANNGDHLIEVDLIEAPCVGGW